MRPGLQSERLIYTSRSHERENWRAACVSLPVQKRDTGGLTPFRSPVSFPIGDPIPNSDEFGYSLPLVYDFRTDMAGREVAAFSVSGYTVAEVVL